VAAVSKKLLVVLLCAAKRNHSLTGSAAKKKAGKKRVATVGALRFSATKAGSGLRNAALAEWRIRLPATAG